MAFVSNYLYEYKTNKDFYSLGWADGYAAWEECASDEREIVKQLYGKVDETILIDLINHYLIGFETGYWLNQNAEEIHDENGMLYDDVNLGISSDHTNDALAVIDEYKNSIKSIDVVYLDYDGVIKTEHKNDRSAIDSQVRILSFICRGLDLKVVITTNRKKVINPITFETEDEEMKYFLDCMKKYGVPLIGMTPIVDATYEGVYYNSWKDYEIIEHLLSNPQIKHYCVFDDGGFIEGDPNLELVKDHLVKTLYSSKVASAEGIGYEYIPLIEDVLKLPNDITAKNEEYAKRKIRKAI